MSKKEVSGFTKLPWERRGNRFYEAGTQKKVLEINMGWRTSAEAKANGDLVAAALNEYFAKREPHA